MVLHPKSASGLTPEQQKAIDETLDSLIENCYAPLLEMIGLLGVSGITSVDVRLKKRDFSNFSHFLAVIDIVKNVIEKGENFGASILKDIKIKKSASVNIGLAGQKEVLDYLEKIIESGYGYLLYSMTLIGVDTVPTLETNLQSLLFNSMDDFNDFKSLITRCLGESQKFDDALAEKKSKIHNETAEIVRKTVEESGAYAQAVIDGLGDYASAFKIHHIYHKTKWYLDGDTSALKGVIEKVVLKQPLDTADMLVINFALAKIQGKIDELDKKYKTMNYEEKTQEGIAATIESIKYEIESFEEISVFFVGAGAFALVISDFLKKLSSLIIK